LAYGLIYGYFPNAAKTCLTVKPDQFDSAQTLFNGTNIEISCEGQHHLGATIGFQSFTESYVSKKVKTWSDEILSLSKIAETHPHSAYSAFTHSVRHCWSYVVHTIESVGAYFQPLEEAIHQHFLPALTGRMPGSEVERELLLLRGLNIPCCSDFQFQSSKLFSASLVAMIQQ